MNDAPKTKVEIGTIQRIGLLCLFFLISCGLGYPILNRYDPRQTPGLADVKSYAALVSGEAVDGPDHLRYRVLVPLTARPFYRLAQGRVSSWDPLAFGLLAADSLFVAGTAVLIVLLGTSIEKSYAAAVVGALLYLVNFCVPNMRLAGLVDAGEGFFTLWLMWALWTRRLFFLPVITMLGVLAKETFIPISVAITFTWLLVVRKELESPVRSLLWILGCWIVGLLGLVGVQWSVTGHWNNPVNFGLQLHQNVNYVRQFTGSVLDKNLWYIFGWLLPVGLPKLGRFPKSLLVPTAVASVMVFVLDGYYGGAPGTVGRALFTVAGPMLAISSAVFILGSNHAKSGANEA